MKAFSAAAIDLAPDVALVEASAGTGKTYAITTLFVRLVVEEGLPVERVLVVTFTIAATAELRARVRRRLSEALVAFERMAREGHAGDDADLAAMAQASSDLTRDCERLRVAVTEIDQASIHTIHGFCLRVLEECTFATGARFELELVPDLATLRDEVLRDYCARALATADEPLARLLRGISPDDLRPLADVLARHPRLRVRPERAPEPPPLDRDGLRAAFEAARAEWDRARVELALARCAALPRRTYQKRNLQAWSKRLDAFFAAPLADQPALPDGTDKLCASALSGACDGAPPDDAFFSAWDRFALVLEHYRSAAHDHALRFRHQLLDYLRSELPLRKARAGVVGFEDLLGQVEAALSGPGGARLGRAVAQRWPVALIDEFQDTDPIQYAIFAALRAGGARLLLIGDPKQAIYSFRGADVFAYLGAGRQVPPERRFTLDVNRRSDPSLLRAVAALFGGHARPFLIEDIAFPQVRARQGSSDAFTAAAPLGSRAALEILFVPRPAAKRAISKDAAAKGVAALVAGDIAALLASGSTLAGRAVDARDIAVLTRTNDQALAVQTELRARGVPSVVLGEHSVLRSTVAAELEQVLAAVLEPGNGGAVRAALTSTMLGFDALAIAELEENGPGDWETWLDRFRAWHELWSARGFVRMMRALIAQAGVAARLLPLVDGERRMTDLLHLTELLHTNAQHLGPAGMLHWLAEQRAAAMAKGPAAEEAQLRLESDARAVQITTIHRSKGLEYPIVYCPSSWDSSVAMAARGPLAYHDGDEQVLALDERSPLAVEALERVRLEAVAEGLRLAYVALTRAKHHCTLVWGAIGDYAASALAYLLHPPVLSQSPSFDELTGAVAGLDDDKLRQGLAALAGAAGGAIGWRETPLAAVASDPLAAPLAAEPRTLRAAQMSRRVPLGRRVASFSELASGHGDAHDPREGRDRDEAVAAEEAPHPATIPSALREFPRGAKAGNFFHELLEAHDFTDPASLPPLCEQKLCAYGYDPDWRDGVCEGLGQVLRTPLGEGRPRLCDVPRSARLDELEFFLPVASGAARTPADSSTRRQLEIAFPGEGLGRITQGKLAAVFADHPSHELHAGYATRLAALRFSPLEGWLKGYIDLVFAHEDRFFLVDYKSNHLGVGAAAYGRARLAEAMSASHYYLQYHLYALALHRHLARTLRGYQYERHFGGVLYLFLRGMAPKLGEKSGVFFEKPPRARLEALGELFDNPGGAP